MPDRDGYIAGVPCWVDTSHPDPEAVLPFYRGLFGWDFEDVMPDGAGSHYFIGRIRERDVAAIGSSPAGAPPLAAWNTYIWVDNADEVAVKVRAAGGGVVAEPFDVMDSGRMAVLSDPEGSTFCVWQANNTEGRRLSTSTVPSTSMASPRGIPRRPGRSTAPCSVGPRWTCRSVCCGL